MKKYILPTLFLSFLFWSCEDEVEDTTPPTVSISYPLNNSTVSEMITINCISSDNEGVEKVELWVNGVTTELIDDSEPYSFDWNTTLLDNGNYTITIRSYDTNDNTTDSEPIVITVDNTQSNPQPVNITSVDFYNGGFTITWNQSTDGDFSSYELEKSTDSTMNSPSVVFTTDSLEQTIFFDTDVNPLIYQYYRVTVIDTFDYETKGEIVYSSLDLVPSSINVESVEYTLEEMTISWSESSDDDFKHYNLLYSDSESGEKTSVTTITNKSTISHSITDFNPNIENWYWVEVSDTLGQTSIGNGMTNHIDTPPIQSVLNPIVFWNNSFVISWSQNIDDDFKSYILYESESEDMIDQIEIYSTEEISETSHTISEMVEKVRYYQVVVSDYWGNKSLSNIERGIGSIVFNQSVGGIGPEIGYSIKQTDGGYILTGFTNSYGNGGRDVWLYKTDFQGEEEWNQTFGGSEDDYGRSIQQTTDGGYIITGNTTSYGNGDSDVWLIKTDSQGNEEWNQTFGGSFQDIGYSVQQTTDGGYILTGYRGLSFENSNSDIWLIKTDSEGNTEPYGD